MDALEPVPSAMLRPLPANATSDAKLHDRIDSLGRKLPDSMEQVAALLGQVKASSDYDAAVNRAAAHVWSALERFYASGDPAVRVALLRFACAHLPEAAQAHICRRLVKDAAWRVRAQARRLVESASRALGDPTPGSMRKLVHDLLMKRLLDGQFEESGLTLTELHLIEESLCKSLIALFHARIKYPEEAPRLRAEAS